MVLHGTASPDLLDTYEADRVPVIRGVLKTTEAMTGVMTSGRSLLHRAVVRLLPFALPLNLVQTEATGVLSQTKLGYRESTLSTNHGAHGLFRAGDRIPFQQVNLQTDSTQQPAADDAQLQTLVDPSRLTVFADAASTNLRLTADLQTALKPWSPSVVIHTLSAPSGSAQAKTYTDHFGSNGFIILARPDSYAGFVGGPRSLPQLLDWLQHWFPLTGSDAPAHASTESRPLTSR